MRLNLAVKAMLRAPLKTAVTFLLLAAVTFAMFSRVAGHLIVMRESDRAVSFYRGIGAPDLKVFDTYFAAVEGITTGMKNAKIFPPALTKKQIETFASLPQVTSADCRYMTAGVSDSLFRLDAKEDPNYNYTLRFIMEGTFVEYITPYEGFPIVDNQILLVIEDVNMLAGGKEILDYDKANVDVIINFDKEKNMNGPSVLRHCLPASIYFDGPIRNNFLGPDYPDYDLGFFDDLKPGERVLMIGRYEPRFRDRETHLADFFILGDHSSAYIPAFWRLDGLPENYMETDEFAPVRELVEMTNRDFHTFDMVYTSDMASIPRFATKKMLITQGRMLNAADTSACVVNEKLLKEYDLRVGDVITLSLGDRFFEQYSTLGAVAVTPDRYGPLVKTVDLTIVGSYSDSDLLTDRSNQAYKNYSINTIFLPTAMLPAKPPADHVFKPGEFSFIVADAYSIEQVGIEARKLANEYGFNLLYSDSGWGRAGQDLAVAEQVSLVATLLFIGASVAGIYLAVYLLVLREKKAYAIARALGASPNLARMALLYPLLAISVLAISFGSAAGLLLITQTASVSLSKVLEITPDLVPDTSLPVPAILISLISELAFLAVVTGLMMRSLRRTPVLALLQGGNVKNVNAIESRGKQCAC